MQMVSNCTDQLHKECPDPTYPRCLEILVIWPACVFSPLSPSSTEIMSEEGGEEKEDTLRKKDIPGSLNTLTMARLP